MGVLWLVYSEEKSAMSYLFMAMDKAKETIKTKLKIISISIIYLDN
jgi:hypothetical protein